MNRKDAARKRLLENAQKSAASVEVLATTNLLQQPTVGFSAQSMLNLSPLIPMLRKRLLMKKSPLCEWRRGSVPPWGQVSDLQRLFTQNSYVYGHANCMPSSTKTIT